MPEFLRLVAPREALDALLNALPESRLGSETIATSQALGRVLAEDLLAPHPLPEFRRSTVDGYAVRARDTHGASEGLPAYLAMHGEVAMGSSPTISLLPGECALIHTGGMLPEGADSVVMLEHAQEARSGAGERARLEIEVLRAVAQGENVIQVGEEVGSGQVVLARGSQMRPAAIGGCMALGICEVRVVNKVRVGIISSGDEVVPPEQRPTPGQVRDVNTYTLASLLASAGAEVRPYGILPDRLEAMRSILGKALLECDLVLITAGSSASARDLTATAISSFGPPGVLVHGVNVRPGKPTILAVCQGKPVLGLPGNPVSALVIAGLFAVPVVERLSGLRTSRPRPSVLACLELNIPSQAGREDWVAAELVPGTEGGWLARPIFAKSNLIFSLASADGLIRIAPEANGLAAGEVVEVFLLSNSN